MSITRYLDLDPRPAPDVERGSIFFVGTATMLIEFAGFTVLTDPNFLHQGRDVRLGYGLCSRRLTDPALEISDLPDLDLVLLSHLHEDHWDRVAKAHFDRRLPIVTTPHAADKLGRRGFLAPEPLATWQTLAVTRGDVTLRITAMPGRHGPQHLSRLLPPVMGSMLEYETASGGLLQRIYVTGDTLVFKGLEEIRHRCRDIDLAILHLGGTRVLGVLLTMDADQGVEALQIIDPKHALPVHYDDYTVFRSRLSDFQRAVEAAHLADRVQVLGRGKPCSFTGRPVQRSPVHLLQPRHRAG